MHVHDNESIIVHVHTCATLSSLLSSGVRCNLVIIVVVRCSVQPCHHCCCQVFNVLSGAELSSSVVQLVVVCMNNYMCRYILAVYIVLCYVLSGRSRKIRREVLKKRKQNSRGSGGTAPQMLKGIFNLTRLSCQVFQWRI